MSFYLGCLYNAVIKYYDPHNLEIKHLTGGSWLQKGRVHNRHGEEHGSRQEAMVLKQQREAYDLIHRHEAESQLEWPWLQHPDRVTVTPSDTSSNKACFLVLLKLFHQVGTKNLKI